MEPATHESEILKKLDGPAADDENQWPQFPLRDVSVTSVRSGRPVSLLNAHTGGKVRVTGMLHEQDTDPESRKRFKKRRHKPVRVEVNDVQMYSYGKYDDESLAFWAAGEAGWFEVRTVAQGYREAYGMMEEATEILYFLLARANRQRKDWRKATEKQVHDIMRVTVMAFLESDANKKARGDYHEAVEAFLSHRHFLIKCMLEGAEGVDWQVTPFLRWFHLKVPEDYGTIQEIVNQTGAVSTEDVDEQPAMVQQKPTRRGRELHEEAKAEEPPVGRRSKRLAKTPSDEASSSEELTYRRGKARGKHKRKSMLRVPGSAKTPRKSYVKLNALASVREPEMQYFRDQRHVEMEGVEYEDLSPAEETDLKPSLVSELRFSEVDEDMEKVTPMDSYWEPRGLGGQWNCPYDGCNHTVYEAETAAGKALIKTHYALTHQDSIEELIRSEARPWAKTSYLLEKVRSMQAQASIADPGDKPSIFPAPIKRKI